MRLIFYIFLISQFFNFIKVFAEKTKEASPKLNSITWEKVKEKNSRNLEAMIIWEPYEINETFPTKIPVMDKFENNKIVDIEIVNNQENKKDLLQIEPHIPINKYLNSGEFLLSTFWKSAFDGGAAGGTGHQNSSMQLDYGLSDFSLLSFYLSVSDDPLYNLIEGEIVPNYWGSAAIAYKKLIFESDNKSNTISLAGSFEYWNISSGSGRSKSIYNEIDNAFAHDKQDKFIYSFSLPFSKKLNNKAKISLVPGAIFIPEKLGDKNIGKNFYGNNYFLASGLNFDITDNIQFVGSYTYLFGPGHNSFDKNLKYYRNSIYSYGLNWDVNEIIAFEGKITNGYGSTPSTSLLTIPSDNKPLYYLGGKYKPSSDDTKFISLDEKNKPLLFGGVINNNALFPQKDSSQISFNYDEKGNLFASYGYSLSNIFQLELSSGSFKNVNLVRKSNSSLQNTHLKNDDYYYRIGGKLLILSPQKNDLFWMTLRTSLGRNEGSNREGYLFSELINTFRVNDFVALSINPKYFFSGIDSFAGVGVSSYIKIIDNLQLIAELNASIKDDSDLNSSFALRYSFDSMKSVDVYYSNAAGINDIGTLMQDNEYRFGIKLNFLY